MDKPNYVGGDGDVSGGNAGWLSCTKTRNADRYFRAGRSVP